MQKWLAPCKTTWARVLSFSSLLAAVCAKHARRFPEKCSSKTNTPVTKAPKKLLAIIDHKAAKNMPLCVHAKKSGQKLDFGRKTGGGKKEESGVWQKAILMGEKCRPPEFSGVIYYDYAGNRIREMPMSPLRNFDFPVEKIGKLTAN